MTQYIAPNMAMAMQYSNQQGMDPSNRYGSGILSLADGGFIGGGNIQGQAMPGGRTGFGLLKKIKKGVKKLIPKELAGIMQVAAPFVAPMGPWGMAGAAALSGLGQYKSKGKISPLQLMMSMAPGLKGKHVNPIFEKMGRSTGIADDAGVMRNLMRRIPGGTQFDETLFGKTGVERIPGGPFAEQLKGTEYLSKYVTEPTKGWLGKGGVYGGPMDLLGRGTKSILTDAKTGGPDKQVIIALGIAGMSYAEANKQMQLLGKGDLEEEYGVTENEWLGTNWENALSDNPIYDMAQGGRAGYANGGIHNARPGYLWGSDKGEGLGGEEVEADMRFTGGFMPYGEAPKADDVPARLSKDEFVFTDEAVKGAGQGDVNVGAERLYNIMKQLEQTGAQNMEGIFNNPLAMS